MFDYRFFRRSHVMAMGYGASFVGAGRCVGVSLVATVWVIVCIVLGGCGLPRVEPIEHLRGNGLDEPFPGASMARFHMPFEKLDLAISVAFKRQHWGLLRLKLESADGDSDEALQGVLRASALLPDGRTAQVVAWVEGGSEFAVAVRVGHFGDRGHERVFLEILGKTLRTKLTRRSQFKLPNSIPEELEPPFDG